VAEQELARLGQRDGAWPAGPVDQRLADDPLEHRDLLADRRLRVAQPPAQRDRTCPPRRSPSGDQVAQFEPEPKIRIP
jgi:hypothetical protein